MRITIAILFALVPAIAVAQSPKHESVEMLVKKLGSGSFQERQAATLALQERPDAAQALREAARSPDAETAKRATEILEYFDRRLVRELRSSVKDGRVDQAIVMLSKWPTGKHEQEAWDAARDLARSLVELHKKKGGANLKNVLNRCALEAPLVLSQKRITELTPAKVEQSYFIRAGEVDLDCRRSMGQQLQNLLDTGAFTVAERSFRMMTARSHVIFAGGPVELEDGGEGLSNLLVVSAGDVVLDCTLVNSLVIARGKITITGQVEDSHLISGKKVSTTRNPVKCIITENEPNPLGYIRWSETAKGKATTKTK